MPRLNAEIISAELELRVGSPVRLLYLESCASTNSECQALAEHNTIIIAEQQTAGRGRRGNHWLSPSTENIYCSIGLNKKLAAQYLGMISLQVGVSIAQVLHLHGYAEVGLKWPNDIWLQGRKLGGILIETRQLASDNFFLSIGFGLNIHLEPSQLEQIDRPATSLSSQSIVELDRQGLLIDLIGRILPDVMSLDVERIDGLIHEFNRLDAFQGRTVMVKANQHEIDGVHRGVEKTGQIRIETDQGIQLFSAADISLRERPCC